MAEILIRPGSSNATAVKQIKKRLNALLSPSPRLTETSAAYGPKTAQAVTRFQRKAGLKQTGIVDTATWNALDAQKDQAEAPDSVTLPLRDVRISVPGRRGSLGTKSGTDWNRHIKGKSTRNSPHFVHWDAGGRLIESKITGIVFEVKNGAAILTNDVLYQVMAATKAAHMTGTIDGIKTDDPELGGSDLIEVMSNLDTPFYEWSQHNEYKKTRFAYEVAKGKYLKRRFLAEEVNYIGVGMGFKYYKWFLNSMRVGHAVIRLWNLVKWGDLAKPGEHYWAKWAFLNSPYIETRNASKS